MLALSHISLETTKQDHKSCLHYRTFKDDDYIRKNNILVSSSLCDFVLSFSMESGIKAKKKAQLNG